MTQLTDSPLAQSVDQWVHTTQGLPDSALETAWTWRAHDEEGIRFAFFRVFEELRTLAANLTAERFRSGPPISAAQHALAQYHVAWRDLQAVLVGVSEDMMDQEPVPGEWSIRQVLGHMFATPRNFFCAASYGLREHRAGRKIQHPMPEEDKPALLGHTWEQFADLMSGTRAAILADYATFHDRVLHDLADVREDELNVPTLWWEGYEVPVQFRLHRFESHMRQHTIQLEKTLDALNLPPTEAKRLNRNIASALAECEGLHIGAWDLGKDQMQATAGTISAFAGEIAEVVA